jgi:hypothetical protein
MKTGSVFRLAPGSLNETTGITFQNCLRSCNVVVAGLFSGKFIFLNLVEYVCMGNGT